MIFENTIPEIFDDMALAQNRNISLHDALLFVPKCEGNPCELLDFLNCCKGAKSVLPDGAKENLAKLFHGMKLSAKVKASINFNTPTTLVDFFGNLKKGFRTGEILISTSGRTRSDISTGRRRRVRFRETVVEKEA